MAAPSEFRRAYPPDSRVSEWHAGDGWPLRRFDWPGDGRRGSILFQTGRGDVFEKYLETLAHWQAQGWSITAFDWRGQGGSGRLSSARDVGHIGDFQAYRDDIAAFWAAWKRETAGKGPRVLMGHSMGGFLVCDALVRGLVDPDAAVLSAPMLGLAAPMGAWLSERVAWLVSRLGDPARRAWKTNERPGAKLSRQLLLTHDADRYADEPWWWQARPDLALGPPSWRWLSLAFAETRRLRSSAQLKTMRVPVLMLVADRDGLVSPKAALAVAARLPDVQVVRFPDSAHEILREADPVRDRALAAVDAFLGERAPA